MNELDVTNIEPTAHAVPLVNITRADEIRPSLAHEDALRMRPDRPTAFSWFPRSWNKNRSVHQSAEHSTLNIQLPTPRAAPATLFQGSVLNVGC
ncbi:MAG: Asp-tRNA(Asn)/Glu-tRNA(Gln) amidotransferase subunit GatC [Limisphaerales bacterium]